MTNTDISTARKRLARELQIIVIVQVIALCAVWLLIFGSSMVSDETIHVLCDLLGVFAMIVFVVSAIWGCIKFTNVDFLPISMRLYAWGIFLFLPILFAVLYPLSHKEAFMFFAILIYIFPFCCTIPQFFIARWLAKEAKDDTIEADVSMKE
jgi:hypothetical protein